MISTSDRVVVAKVSQPMEATPIQILLGSCGIDSELDGELTVAANPLLSNAIGGIRIVVAQSDAERAVEILQEHQLQAEQTENAPLPDCPECDCKDTIRVKRPWILGLLTVLTFGAFCLLYPWARYRCQECGHTWR